MSGSRRIAGGLVGLLALLVAWTSFASAAGLGVVGGPRSLVHVSGAARCATGPLSAAPSGTPTSGQYTQVTVSGINGSCQVGAVAVVMAQAPYTVRFVGAASVSGNSFTATATAFTPPSTAAGWAFVSLDGWIVPATWTYMPPPQPPVGAATCRIPSDPSIPCTATISGTTQWPSPITHWQRFITVSTTHSSPVVWEATFNLSTGQYPVFANRLHDLQGGLILVSTSGCGANPRTVTVRGTTGWGNYHQIFNGKPSQMQIEGSTTGSGNLLTCPP